jgi:predicted transcriptional regulator
MAMKRTTIMADEDVLYALKRIARRQRKSVATVIRDALETYVVQDEARGAEENPLLALIALGDSKLPVELADGGDEALLFEGVHPVFGFSSHDKDEPG